MAGTEKAMKAYERVKKTEVASKAELDLLIQKAHVVEADKATQVLGAATVILKLLREVFL